MIHIRTDVRNRSARALRARPGAGHVRLRLDVVDARTRTIAATVDGVGLDVVGFAAGDRVAFLLPTSEALPAEGDVAVVHVGRLIGVPRDVPLARAAALTVPGVLARALVKGTANVGPGHVVAVVGATTLVGSLAAAWARSLGATVIDAEQAKASSERVDAVIDARDISHLARKRGGGQLAQNAAEVLQAVRDGMFDDIRTDREGSRSVAA